MILGAEDKPIGRRGKHGEADKLHGLVKRRVSKQKYMSNSDKRHEGKTEQERGRD